MINITTAAAQEIKRLQNNDPRQRNYLYLQVEEGGCSGWHYVLDFVTTEQNQEHTYETNGIAITTNKQSWHYLQGLTIDYSEDLMGGGFRFHNPNALSTCGCGNSFTVEVDS